MFSESGALLEEPLGGNLKLQACLILLSLCIGVSPASAEETQKLLLGLEGLAGIGYLSCSVAAQKAWYDDQNSGENTAAAKIQQCHLTNKARLDTIFKKLKNVAANKPAAQSALKDFYTYWNIKVGDTSHDGPQDDVLEHIRVKIESIKTELEY